MASNSALVINLMVRILLMFMLLDFADCWWSQLQGEEEVDERSTHKNRHFSDCKCIQKVRTTYLTSDVCGQAALCYWEIWNYKHLKFKAKGENYTDEECDRYTVQKFACLIGYPKPQYPNEMCYTGYAECNKVLARMLYDDCEPIRQERGLAKPEDVDWRINIDNLNYGLRQDEEFQFKPRPSVEQPTHNGYYILSCPVIYRFPYFTIDLLLKTVDPTIEYDETNAVDGLGEMLPKYVREGVNNERILNFDALSLDQSMIHWCGIPRNYICIDHELDPDGDICTEEKMKPRREVCEGPNAAPPRESFTKQATNPQSPAAVSAEEAASLIAPPP